MPSTLAEIAGLEFIFPCRFSLAAPALAGWHYKTGPRFGNATFTPRLNCATLGLHLNTTLLPLWSWVSVSFWPRYWSVCCPCHRPSTSHRSALALTLSVTAFPHIPRTLSRCIPSLFIPTLCTLPTSGDEPAKSSFYNGIPTDDTVCWFWRVPMSTSDSEDVCCGCHLLPLISAEVVYEYCRSGHLLVSAAGADDCCWRLLLTLLLTSAADFCWCRLLVLSSASNDSRCWLLIPSAVDVVRSSWLFCWPLRLISADESDDSVNQQLYEEMGSGSPGWWAWINLPNIC